MIIFIEGVDRTGKTELAREIQRRANDKSCDVYHFGAPTKSTAIEEYIGPLEGYNGSNHIIIDRYHLGEAIWPKYFNRDSRMSRAEHQMIELFLLSRGAVCVITERDNTGIRRGFQEAEDRGEPEPLPIDDVLRAKTEFYALGDSVLCPTFWYDHGSGFRGQDVDKIIGMARRAETEFRSEDLLTGTYAEAVGKAIWRAK